MARKLENTNSPLARWMTARGIMAMEVAKALGVGKSAITKFCKPEFYPSRIMVRRLVALTHGEILKHGSFGYFEVGDCARKYAKDHAKGAEMIRLGRQRQREMERKGRK